MHQVELGDRQIKEGDKVVVFFPSARSRRRGVRRSRSIRNRSTVKRSHRVRNGHHPSPHQRTGSTPRPSTCSASSSVRFGTPRRALNCIPIGPTSCAGSASRDSLQGGTRDGRNSRSRYVPAPARADQRSGGRSRSSTVGKIHLPVARRERRLPPAEPSLTPAMQRTVAALQEYADDPFRGARERRVMADDMTVSEMEANAAREAMEHARIGPDDVDVILSQTPVPDQLMVNGACVTHRLPRLASAMSDARHRRRLQRSGSAPLVGEGPYRLRSGSQRAGCCSSTITRVHGQIRPSFGMVG